MPDPGDDALPPFPFGELPALPEPSTEGSEASDASPFPAMNDHLPAHPPDGLPDWLAIGQPPMPEPNFEFEPEPPPPSQTGSVPYWPGTSLNSYFEEADDPTAGHHEPRPEDTLSDYRQAADEFPPMPSTVDQMSPTERMSSEAPEDELPLPPPFEAELSKLSPFGGYPEATSRKSASVPPAPPRSPTPPREPVPEPAAALPPEPAPVALTRTPPPVESLDLPPVSAIWRTRRITVQPKLEDNGSIAVYRLVVQDEAKRGYQNCKVTFPIPAGLKQVQASRKPNARKGLLNWHLGPIGPDELIPLSVKLPVAKIGAELATMPRVFEISYQPLPGARLLGELASPPAVAVDEPFTISMRVSNTGELPSNIVRVRVTDRTGGHAPVIVTAPAIQPGDSTTIDVELRATTPGRHEWLATVESTGSESAESIFTADVVHAALTIELRHASMMRVDDEEEISLCITNNSAVPARGVTAMLTMPEELTFASAPGGEFDRALNLIGWLIGDIPAQEARTVRARLLGFAPGLVRIQARAEAMTGSPVVTTSNLFVEVDARSTSSSLDKLLAAMQDAIPEDDDNPQPSREMDHDHGSRHVVFRLAKTSYAVRIENVREVLRPSKLTPVPGTPDWLPGVANVRGDIVSIIDLPRFLGVDLGDAPPRGLIVTQSDDGQTLLGFLVDDIVGIRRLPAVRPLEDELQEMNPIAEYLDGVTEFQDQLVPFLNLPAIFAATESGTLQMA